MNDEKVFVTIQMSRELDMRARLQAAKLRISRSEVLRLGTDSWLTQIERESVQGPAGAGTAKGAKC